MYTTICLPFSPRFCRGMLLCLFSLAVLPLITIAQQPAPVVVNVQQPLADISPNMWGIFFEDINFAADGGLYAELVKNRSFEFNDPLMGWEAKAEKEGAYGSLLVLNRGKENPANPRFIRVKVNSQDKQYRLSNEGFRGMGIRLQEQYRFSVQARINEGGPIHLHVALLAANDALLGDTLLTVSGGNWKTYTASLTATAAEPKARLVIWFQGSGTMDMDMVSLFPQHTWKQRPGGLREDLVQLLAGLKPGFIRFPGGCIVEGRDLANRYQWKKTVGSINERQLIINRWNTEFSYRSAPDYYQSFGLGFYEYFLLAEDLGAQPLPILNCGMACQFNTAEVVPADQVDPYIQDALDLIEFANGDAHTQWGGLRAAMGHPAPFNLQMMGVGNEQWGEQYVERNKLFTAAIKSKYPEIQLVNSTGPYSNGSLFDYLNDTLRKMHADILDEHYYRPPEWFLKQAGRYDAYDRKGAKIFAGEYAAHVTHVDDALKKNNWRSALSEAAFMTGLERNADVVRMASYAPLLAHVEAWQWAPDLIWFDNLRAYGTPNYYVQQLYSLHKGSREVSIRRNGRLLEGGADSLYAAACTDALTGELILKLVNTGPVQQEQQVLLDGVKKTAAQAQIVWLQSNDLEAVNSLTQPRHIFPQYQNMAVKNKRLQLSLLPYSFTIVRVKVE